MRKILILGHTKGVGKAIAARMTADGHDVKGLSRTDGNFDMEQSNSRERVVNSLDQYDTLMIVANAGFSNVEMLYRAWGKWRGRKDKTIVVIGSHITEAFRNFSSPYQIHKIALDATVKQLQSSSPYPNIVLLRPGWVDTATSGNVEAAKMSADSVADIVAWTLDENANRDFRITNVLFEPKK
jgi:NAD(P)-dependent dehydrogenase (short-subunit alcohol dehydrogenase family)